MSLFPLFPPERIRALRGICRAMPGSDADAQCKRLLVALQTLGPVNTFEASRLLGLYDPRARAMTLRRQGHNIVTGWGRIVAEAGTAHRIGTYALIEGGGK